MCCGMEYDLRLILCEKVLDSNFVGNIRDYRMDRDIGLQFLSQQIY